jgi:hypothetical protein
VRRMSPGGTSTVNAARMWARRPIAPSATSRCARRVRRAGVTIPGEVSVVGYDDSRLARLAHVNLTTVAQDPP